MTPDDIKNLVKAIFTAITVLYYLHWFIPLVRRNGGKVLRWLGYVAGSLFLKRFRESASEIGRAALHERITESLLRTFSHTINLVRLAMLAGLCAYHSWLISHLTEDGSPKTALMHDLSGILFPATIVYLALARFQGYYAERKYDALL